MTSRWRSGRGEGWLPAEAAAELPDRAPGLAGAGGFLQVAVEAGWEPFRERMVAAVDFAAGG